MKVKLTFKFMIRVGLGIALAIVGAPTAARAQASPWFVTYDHHLEEPGSLEIELSPVYATQRGGNDFVAGWTELEYGVKGWWTTSLYATGQSTRRDSTVFTGMRFENRFRPLMHEHRVNPLLYVELERINGADKIMREVVGHDGEADHAEPNAIARAEIKNELETKLVLSSQLGGWNLAENLIVEKNFAEEEWEFGYAIGISRPLALAARPDDCTLCPENFSVGLELSGGLGTHKEFGLRDTSHYLGLGVAWELPSGTVLRLSPTFGLNGNSHRFALRWGIAYEIPGFGRSLHRLFHGGRQ